MTPVASPCTGLCRYDDVVERCDGCGRTLDEIGAWSVASEARRRAIVRAASGRLQS